jgi:Ca2+-binding RTX toxin-like protein
MGSHLVEQLEPRRLLSATLKGAVLFIGGNRRVTLSMGKSATSTLNVRVGDARTTYRGSQVKQIRITGTSGPDRIEAGKVKIPMWIIGRVGNDTITGGDANDTIWGEDGADSISGGGGRDSIRGGKGSDELAGGGGNDKIYGEGGNNLLLGGGGNDVLCASTNAAADTLAGGADADTYDGDRFDYAEWLRAGEGYQLNDGPFIRISFDGVANDGEGNGDDTEHDNVYGLGRIATAGFGDQVDASTLPWGLTYHAFGASPTFHGGKGDDHITLDFSSGDITLGDGNDFLETGDTNDIIDAGPGNDRIILHGGSDTVTGGAGNDSVQSAGSDDIVTGIETFEPRPHSAVLDRGIVKVIGDGNVKAWINAGNPTRLVVTDGITAYSFRRASVKQINIKTNEMDDRIEALTTGAGALDIPMVVDSGAGKDTIIGGSGRDTLDGGRDDDRIYGMGGNDVLGSRSTDGADSLDGGDGNDELYSIDFNYDGTPTLTGGAGNDFLNGAGGDAPFRSCIFDPGGGSDTLAGDQSDEAIFTTKGPIYASFDGVANDGPDREDNFYAFGHLETSGDGDVVDATGLDFQYTGLFYHPHGHHPTFTGNKGSDYLIFDYGGTIIGNGGSDSIETETVGAEPSNITCGPGDDEIRTGDANDTIDGGGGQDQITSGAGDDSVNGGDGDDRIFGAAGNDHLLGGNGNDLLDGGAGKDYLDGGRDNDELDSRDGEPDSLFGGAGDDRAKRDDPQDNASGVEGFLT